MYKQIESWMIAKGLLHPTHSRWEKRSGVLTAASIAAMVLLFAVGLVDVGLFDRLLFPVLRPIGIIALGTFALSVVLGILATNKII